MYGGRIENAPRHSAELLTLSRPRAATLDVGVVVVAVVVVVVVGGSGGGGGIVTGCFIGVLSVATFVVAKVKRLADASEAAPCGFCDMSTLEYWVGRTGGSEYQTDPQHGRR